MRRPALALVPLLAVVLIAAAPQKRAEKKGQADFNELIAGAQKAWSGGKYGACLTALKEVTSVVVIKRVETILAALPTPEGYEVVPDKSLDQVRANQMLAGLSAAIGSTVERKYKGPERLSVTVMADSPMVQMLGMVLANPAMMDANSELIEYDQHKAILKKTGNGASRELTIIISNKHLCMVKYGGDDEGFLFGVFDQAMVDTLARALDS